MKKFVVLNKKRFGLMGIVMVPEGWTFKQVEEKLTEIFLEISSHDNWTYDDFWAKLDESGLFFMSTEQYPEWIEPEG